MEKGQAAFLQATHGLEQGLREALRKLPEEISSRVQEIRLTAGFPPQIMLNNRLTELSAEKIAPRQLGDSLFSLCGGSIHSHQRELARGYLSIEGGHRAGFAATAVYDANGTLTGFRDISSIVIRIAKSFEGISLPLIKRAFKDRLCGLIIAGPPASGKTTVLKDMAARLSYGAAGCERAVVVDERGELGQCGKSLLLRGYDKAQGMLLAVRNLSPQVILCDEIGDMREADAVKQALNSGVYVVTTVHAESKRQLLRRPVSKALMQSGAFELAAILSQYPVPGSVREVLSCDALLDEALGDSADSLKLLYSGRREGDELPREALLA